MSREGLEFMMAGLLRDAALQLSVLTGSNLETYCRTFAVFAKTAADKAEVFGIIPKAEVVK